MCEREFVRIGLPIHTRQHYTCLLLQSKLTTLTPVTSSKARAFVRDHASALESEIEAIQNAMSEENLESAKVAHLCKRLRCATSERATGLESNGRTHTRVMVEIDEGQKRFPDGSYMLRSLDSATYQLPEFRKGKLLQVGGRSRKFIVSDARGNIGKGVNSCC